MLSVCSNVTKRLRLCCAQTSSQSRKSRKLMQLAACRHTRSAIQSARRHKHLARFACGTAHPSLRLEVKKLDVMGFTEARGTLSVSGLGLSSAA